MARNDSVVHEGKVYYSIPATARLLSMTKAKIKAMMGRDELEWTQLRVNGRLVITAESVTRYLKRQ